MSIGNYDEISGISTEELIDRADKIRRRCMGERLEVCSIINARSGSCPEDCKYCAQSARYCTDVKEYPLVHDDDILGAARLAGHNGAERFGIVTSGNRLTREDIKRIAATIREMTLVSKIKPCASLGALEEEDLRMLKEAGLTRYHHNIETSARFYPNVVTTHDHSQRVNTIKAAKRSGLEVCSGGILGMGETWQDRVDMALLLKELEVDSVPLNFLVPINGTPMAGREVMSPEDALRAIAIFRIILEDVEIKIVAGREAVFKDMQEMIFKAGANGMMIGGYLTIAGRTVEEDTALLGQVRRSWRLR
ncbi:MAG: biotin synthase BioB [Candidatus Omnitrophica bacterium]|nr:biotin synthase BioB [Candidatus Omnitrophota bacterium]